MDRYAVIGYPIAQSKSPFIHARFARQTGQALVYDAAEVERDAFAAALRSLREQGYAGLNVTAPHKLAAMEACEALSERAQLAGAVNTMIRTDTGWRGDNTDGEGLVRDLQRLGFAVAGRRVLVLGAGGAILLIMQLQKKTPAVTSVVGADAAVVAEVPTDAGVVDPDAQVIAEIPVDAGTRVATNDKAVRDAGVAAALVRPGRGNVTIEVLTRPGDANVFVGPNYRGPSGVRLTERRGTKLKIECKTDRMKGSVEVTFDGNLSAVMCTAARDRFCVPGLKNPYDDCEEDPNATP